ncbi:hypothetical protein KFE25_011047 [Diacronema lutheri]|uniref:Cytochrome b561 domain-containing protein n=1 Tax=Diacronema lutheri TaxID=2081491 RepID=A0A8J6CA13_DIALT|nr:hypothetical protein KFE25_011047 [Diacronema lutheri]
MLVACSLALLGRQVYQQELPNGANVPGSSLGHRSPSGGGARTGFANDFVQAGRRWTKALCEADSDGDGVANGVELGDPSCTWSPGQKPGSVASDPSVADAQVKEGKTEEEEEEEKVTPRSAAWVLAHGIFMLVAWGGLVPLGVAAAIGRKSAGPSWFVLHKWANMSATILTVVGAATSIGSLNSHGNSLHAIFGFIVLALSVPMMLSGLLRPAVPEAGAKAPDGASAGAASLSTDELEPAAAAESSGAQGAAPPKSARRRIFEAVHKNVGRLLAPFALVTAALGIALSLGL